MNLPNVRSRLEAAFTLLELLVSVAVLALLILLLAQLFNSAAVVSSLSTKRIDVDGQARALFDRMAIDFAQIVRRNDVDYFLKSSPANLQSGPANDQMAFFCEVPGYSSAGASPLSVVGYRVNPGGAGVPLGLQRLGKGLPWNASSLSETPMVFLPIPLATPRPTASPVPVPSPPPAPTPAFPQAGNMDPDPDYEMIAPQVFRLEYSYILKGAVLPDGTVLPSTPSSTPWDIRIPGHTSENGLQDVEALVVTIAIIDDKSRLLVTDAQLAALAATMVDFDPTMQPGELAEQWQSRIDADDSGILRAAASAIRVYSRHFVLAD